MPQIHRNALILHAHLPWVRHAESLHCPEEDWWLEAVTESLIPLLEMLHRLKREGIPYKTTLAITPTVLAMLRDPLMQQRTEACLDRNLHLAHTEIERGSDPAKRNLAQWYADHFHRLHSYFRDRWKRDLVDAIKDLRNSGHLEIPASAATHALLPLFLKSPDVLRAQINTGCTVYEGFFGSRPKLFWLPDCAYSPVLEPLLTAAGIEHIVLDEHAVTYSDHPPEEGIYDATQTPSGLRVSCRDLESSGYIFKPEAGLAHDTRYRESPFALDGDTPVNSLKIQLAANGDLHAAALNTRCMDSPAL
jgi:1,4-alpha-glucan branching enzyme